MISERVFLDKKLVFDFELVRGNNPIAKPWFSNSVKEEN